MPDIFTQRKRSDVMARIRSSGNSDLVANKQGHRTAPDPDFPGA
jgi:G:T-mismatch repair DNA endonuclease (very short patch repair protein)